MSEQQQHENIAARVIQMMIDSGIDEQKILEHERKLRAEGKLTGSSYYTEKKLREFITIDPKMLEIKEKVRQVAELPYPVLIMGDSGVGKELIATALHGSREGKLVALNVTALPEQLIESDLFGHKRGAFTGALEDKPGMLQIAHNGTVFLDEIGELPMALQAKLLRVLQEMKIRRIGDTRFEEVKFRLVLATNKNIKQLVTEGKFREDLYWRICAIELHLTPLRERLGDCVEIVNKLCPDFPSNNVEYWKGVGELRGNCRELQHRITRYKVFGEI